MGVALDDHDTAFAEKDPGPIAWASWNDGFPDLAFRPADASGEQEGLAVVLHLQEVDEIHVHENSQRLGRLVGGLEFLVRRLELFDSRLQILPDRFDIGRGLTIDPMRFSGHHLTTKRAIPIERNQQQRLAAIFGGKRLDVNDDPVGLAKSLYCVLSDAVVSPVASLDTR